jgi:biopolymer transport protein ExbD
VKKSYRAARIQRRHKRSGASGLNLVSLMDIFTILVFFLLVNSSSALQLPNSKDVELPSSTAQQMPKETVMLMVNQNQILVQGRLIATVEQVLKSEKPLIPELQTEMQLQAQNSLLSDEEKQEGLEITVMGDKKIPYKLLRKILATLSASNYTKISMAVMKRSDKQDTLDTGS